MSYAKRRYKQYKRSPLVRFGKYASRGVGALSGAALGFIRGNIPGAIAGAGTGYAAGSSFAKRNRLTRKDFSRKLSSNKYVGRNSLIGSNPGKVTGSNPGHVFGSNPVYRKPVIPFIPKKEISKGRTHTISWGGRAFHNHYKNY